MLGKSDLQIVTYVIEFLALTQRSILFETIIKKISKTQRHGVLFQKVLGTKLCNGSNKLIVLNNL